MSDFVSVEHVDVRFGDRAVLEAVTFGLAKSSFVSIIGPSGCGKSTLLNVLAGTVQPSAGAVRSPRAAHMPQKDLLLPWRTVLDNTALGLEVQGVRRAEARARAAELFAPFGLDGFERAWPEQLSGGMRQRAALLRTVVQGRPVLLLDEPFGALDAITRIRMQDWLQRMWQEYRWTILMITHDIREAIHLSDRVIVLGGRPARVRADIEIDLPRPRTSTLHADPHFGRIELSVSAALDQGSPDNLLLPHLP
ncbi:ABC transporter ATP-binding protein [Millisia brevis]|uniref:ABC transporter ATP-binding protein n=1 Tax=Millisia brevis TaxID=264148 RepID=UPI000B235F5D|nr:ABC transporter ATP-binding protein [Millisia brevis]